MIPLCEPTYVQKGVRIIPVHRSDIVKYTQLASSIADIEKIIVPDSVHLHPIGERVSQGGA